MLKRILYFGLDPARYVCDGELTHLPLISTKPFPLEQVKSYFTVFHPHVLFTSRAAVGYYFSYGGRSSSFICVGEATAERLSEFGASAEAIAPEPCGEGVIELLQNTRCGPILYPHSDQARPLLPDWIKKRGGTAFALYQTLPIPVTLPNLDLFDRLVFTSPSTVEAFRKLCPALPPKEKCEAIGPITQNALNNLFESTILREN